MSISWLITQLQLTNLTMGLMSYPVETWVLAHAGRHPLHLLSSSGQHWGLANALPFHHGADAESCQFLWKGGQVPRLVWSTVQKDGLGSVRPDIFQVSQQVRVKSMDKELSHLLDSKDSTQSP